MHRVAIVAFDGVVPFDLSMPCDAFGRIRLADGKPGYRVRVCAASRDVDAGAFGLRVPWGLGPLRHAQTIIVPGLADIDRPVPKALLTALRSAARRGARLASICSGAFVLARAGLLDGLRASTHWLAAEELRRRYPKIQVDPNVLYVDNGRILTSAGAAAGFDLCLHLVRLDYGAAVAAQAARLAVMPLERDGGQSQFIKHVPPDAEGASLEPVLRWLEKNLHQPQSLRTIARRATVSVRTLNRRFREQTGTTPLRWLTRARVGRAQQLLETSRHSIEVVAERVGFGSAAVLRQHFRRQTTTSPLRYRQAFRSRG